MKKYISPILEYYKGGKMRLLGKLFFVVYAFYSFDGMLIFIAGGLLTQEFYEWHLHYMGKQLEVKVNEVKILQIENDSRQNWIETLAGQIKLRDMFIKRQGFNLNYPNPYTTKPTEEDYIEGEKLEAKKEGINKLSDHQLQSHFKWAVHHEEYLLMSYIKEVGEKRGIKLEV